MKSKFKLSLLFLSFLISSCAQNEGVIENGQNNVSPFHYVRTITEDSLEQGKLYVTFVFENGSAQQAITYRQEMMKNRIKWEENCQKLVQNENNKVEKITANLAPLEKVEWQFSIFIEPKQAAIEIEKAALLIMNEQFEVEKIVFAPMTYPLK